jgi:thiol-disulfide isomerase/thioredoxin
MKHFTLIAFASLWLTTAAWAQSTPSGPSAGFKITGRINGIKDTTVVLAHYFGATQYIPKDTARVDAAGNFVFSGKNTLPTGLYITVLPKSRYLELLMDNDQEFTFETDTTSLIGSMKVTGSTENEQFYSYQQGLNALYKEAQGLNAQKQLRNDPTTAALVNQKMADLQMQAQSQREQFFRDHNNSFATKILKASAEPSVPPGPKLANGRPDSTWVFNYFKRHFWDDYDFADDRFVRTPILQRKIDRYIKELTVQNADSLIKEADYLVNKAIAGKNKEVKSYVIWYITSQYEQPKVMGTDGLYVHMFEKYYATGVMPVTDSSTVRKIGERVATLKPNLVGKTFVSPVVGDTLRKPIALSTIKADYTVVFFYAPHCGHCRDSAPKLKKFVDEYKGKGVEVLAIPVEDSPEEWKKFIREFGLQKAINGFDYTVRTDYRKQYDVWTTPTVYVLNQNKTIIARKLPVEQIEDFILFHKRQQANQKAAVATAKAKK